MDTIFKDEVLLKSTFAVLVKRLGGTVTVTQKDLDEVSYATLTEEVEDTLNGFVKFTFEERTKQ